MYKNRFVSLSLMLASLVLVGAGCGQKASVSTDTTAAPTTPPKAATSDVCGNPYYPFKPGLAVAYGVTPPASTVGSSDYVLRVVSVSGTTATIRAEMAGGAAADMTADCASGSVALKGSSGLGAAMEGLQFKTTVLSSSGTYMPSDVAAGVTWSNEEKIKMEVTGGPGAIAGMGPITLTTKEDSKAIGEESVTVPAGTYTAMKVELKRTTTSEISGSSVKIPPSTATSTEWWVKGIGMVKTVTKDGGATSTVEAKSVVGQ